MVALEAKGLGNSPCLWADGNIIQQNSKGLFKMMTPWKSLVRIKQLLKVVTLLKSKDGEPGYPEVITILDYSKSGDKYKDITGEYNLVPGKIMEGKPFYIRRGSKASLQFSGPFILFFMCFWLLYIIQGFQWKISSGNNSKTQTNVYGWEFSDSTTVWPQIENLFIVGNW